MKRERKLSFGIAILLILLILSALTIVIQKTHIETLVKQKTELTTTCNMIIDDANTCSEILSNNTLPKIKHIELR